MRTVRRTDRARDDIAAVFDYLGQRSANAVDRLADLLEDKCRLLSANPFALDVHSVGGSLLAFLQNVSERCQFPLERCRVDAGCIVRTFGLGAGFPLQTVGTLLLRAGGQGDLHIVQRDCDRFLSQGFRQFRNVEFSDAQPARAISKGKTSFLGKRNAAAVHRQKVPCRIGKSRRGQLEIEQSPRGIRGLECNVIGDLSGKVGFQHA